ncbi:MAG: hypothetical protein AMXMBFR16_12670 [Candidatus Uhrbacteria bacterium]
MTTTGEKVLAALQAFKLKSEGDGKYRCNNPFKIGSDSHGFTVKIHSDGEHGAFKNHVDGEVGSLYMLAERLGIEVPRAEATETKRAFRDLDEYALAHGADGDVFRRAGWEDCEHDGRPAIQIPTASGVRYRFLDGQKPSFKSPSGYKRCWYGLRRAVDMAAQHGKPLVLCNGEPSVVVAQSFGIPAAAVAGGSENIPPELLEELRRYWQGDVIIAMDCDNQGQIATRKYLEQLPTAAIVDLGMSTRGDLADFCRLYTDSALDELTRGAVKMEDFRAQQEAADLNSTLKELAAVRRGEKQKSELELCELLNKAQSEIDALREKTQPVQVISFAELVDANHKRLRERMKNPNAVQGIRSHLPTVDKMLGGWIGGRIYTLYGDTNMGKSTLAVSIACEFAKLHAGLVVPTETPPAAYLDKFAACYARVSYDKIESGYLSDDEYNRVEDAYAWLEAMNCHVLDAGSPTPQNVSTALYKGMREYGYQWVMIDSVSKMKYPGESDLYNTTRMVADAIQDMARESNLPFLITSQIGRNLKDRAVKLPQINDALGAGTIEQNSDVVLSVYRHEHYVKLGLCDPDPKFPDNTALVTCLKHKWKDAVGQAVPLVFVGGAGFYEMAEDNLPK